MKKSSIIFKMICLAIATVLCFSVIPVMAEETVENVADEIEETTEEVVENETEEIASDVTEDVTEETTEEATEEVIEEEILDLFAATLRDGGVYVTPGEFNAAVFTHDKLRYKVEAGTGNAIRLDGFESEINIEEEISDTAKNMLCAEGTITTEAAHSGYFGLSLTGDMVYRAAVTGESVYVFSAWVKMPAGGTIDDEGRAFIVTGESGNTYVVGWNEIGRDIDATGAWQQIIFTFKAPETGLFAIDFAYRGKTPLAIDDIELYEAEVFINPIEIKSVECTEGGDYDTDGTAFDPKDGFTKTGLIRHKVTLYNSDEDDIYFTAVCISYLNGRFDGAYIVEDCALVQDETEVVLLTYIDERHGDVSDYEYVVYFVNDADHTQVYGKVPDRGNPFVVSGQQ